RVQRLEFANGVTALVADNKVEPGKVRVNVRFGSGNRSVAGNAPNLLWTGDYALMASGVGPWGQNELDQATNGRQIQMGFDIDDDAFEMTAESNPADLRDQLRLMATKLAAPRWDASPIERLRVGLLTGFDLNDATPNAVLDRNLRGWLAGGDTRWAPPSRAAIEGLTPAAFRAFWEPRLKSGPIEVQIFGDLESVDYKQLLAESFGALAPRQPLAPPGGQSVAFAQHNAKPFVAYHTGDKGQAAAMIAWPTSGGIDNMRDARAMDVLAAIFNDRLFDRLRAEQGASYGPVVDSHWPTGFEKSGGYLLVGSSETANHPQGLFRCVDRAARLYQSTAKPGEKPRLLPRLLGPIRVQEQVMQAPRGLSPVAALGEAALHRRAIEEAAPPSILVDEMHRVLHLSDSAGRYLLPPGGPLTGDVADLARPELRFELRSALN
ncbi:MAG: insulinase family protein, partial [Sphingopyxis terrae]